MVTIIRQEKGSICHPCFSYHSGVEASFWEGNEETFRHCAKHDLEWAMVGDIVIEIDEDDAPHFATTCIVCGTPPFAGEAYDGTLTVFA